MMKGIVKIFCGNNHQSNMIYRFLSKVKQKRKKHFDSIGTAFKLHFKRSSIQKMGALVVETVTWLTINNGELGYCILSFKHPGGLYIFFDFGVGVYWRGGFIQKT